MLLFRARPAPLVVSSRFVDNSNVLLHLRYWWPLRSINFAGCNSYWAPETHLRLCAAHAMQALQQLQSSSGTTLTFVAESPKAAWATTITSLITLAITLVKFFSLVRAGVKAVLLEPGHSSSTSGVAGPGPKSRPTSQHPRSMSLPRRPAPILRKEGEGHGHSTLTQWPTYAALQGKEPARVQLRVQQLQAPVFPEMVGRGSRLPNPAAAMRGDIGSLQQRRRSCLLEESRVGGGGEGASQSVVRFKAERESRVGASQSCTASIAET